MMNTSEVKIAALRRAAETTPEYATITPLFIAIFEYVSGREGQTGISVSAGSGDWNERTAKGFPLLSPEHVTVDCAALSAFLLGIIAVLERQGKTGNEALNLIAEKLKSGEVDLPLLVTAILERRRGPLDAAAESIGVPSPLLEYVLEIPFKTALENFAKTLDGEMFPEWQESLCPVCGSRPGMAELSGEEGKRLLSCSACYFRWAFKRIKCPSCGSEDADSFSYFTAGEGPTRVDTCKACSRYIKTRDSRKGNVDVPLEVEDLLTIHLDLLASREGFERGK
jgi:FdhE protein